MDPAISLTLSASVDIAFFTLPILVFMGWAIGQPMSIDFGLLETMILDISLFTMARLVEGGRSNSLSGFLCVGL
jgi:Ca2+:H+ antiporter